MQTIRATLLMLCVGLAMAGSTGAQYGHPLKGSWSGDWGPDDETRHRLLLQFDWDGTAITGTINPGPRAVPIARATLWPSTWTIHIAAEGRDETGRLESYVIEGQLANLGSYHRVITGIWRQGAAIGDFTITRN